MASAFDDLPIIPHEAKPNRLRRIRSESNHIRQ